MSRTRRLLSRHVALAAVVTLAALAVSGVAIAAVASPVRHAHPGPSVRVSAVTRKSRATLVARKLRGPRQPHAAVNPSTLTYPDQGIDVTAATSAATTLADASALPTVAAAEAALNAYPAALSVFGPALAAPNNNIKASLQTVTEQDPIATGVQQNVPYEAWVVQMTGPAIYVGGEGSTPPPAGLQCTDVAVYNLALAEWSELIQSC